MASEQLSNRGVVQLEGHLRFYKTATLILLAAVILLSAVLIANGRQKFARAIRIDGDLICLVKDQTAAERVHKALLEEGKGELPGEASLEQQWSNASWPIEDRDVLKVPEAVERLQEHGVTVLVSVWTIEVNGQPTVNLPTETFAQDVLTRVKLQYVPENEKLIESTFLEDVKIAQTQARTEAVFTEIAAAVEALAEAKGEAETYTVKAGDFPEKIAAAHGMKIDDFYRLNPNAKGRTIHPGDKLKVSAPMGGITVKTVTEVSETVDVEPEVEKVHSVNVPRGETRVASEGAAGKKLVVKHKTYNNDALIQEETKSTQIVEPPSPRRVIVGTDDASAPAGEGD
ncbi:MAG: G5 domain-containing protein [Armatimonadota bacterium]|jgi:LysM repeat protein